MLKEKLSSYRSIYILPRDDLANDILVPAFKASHKVRICMGYFSSASFIEIANGLATFLNENDGKIELIISPHITETDRPVIMMDENELRTFVENSIFDINEGQSDIVKYCLACFGWLLSEGRLDIKIALMDDALFHLKVWLFEDGEFTVAVHGSMNQTKKGISKNAENITISRPWVNAERVDEVEYYEQYFQSLQDNQEEGISVFSLSKAKKLNLIEKYKEFGNKPNEIQTPTIQKPDEDLQNEIKQIKLPTYLNYKSGDFVHQGNALQSWIDAGFEGILNMATGSGKTITALICAHHFQEMGGKLILFIAAPQKPLMSQWLEEMTEFGIIGENISQMKNWEAREKAVIKADRSLNYTSAKAAIFVISNTLLKHERLGTILNKISSPKMLIADECHDLKDESLSQDLKDTFDAKLGLSATPVRQYDELGTNFLKHFFGDICFTFSLEDAIGKCLTPYDYHIIPVYFDSLEMDDFIDLTVQIGKLSWQNESEDQQMLDNLKRQRRKLMETAEMKVPCLKQILKDKTSDLEHTLIYCTDKDPTQLENVNSMLSTMENTKMFRQVTDKETSTNKLVDKILKSFRSGETKILTAKRILDQGVDIPQTKRAYVLASNTIERQWTQRRGRILRKCNEINKEFAEIFDFVILPFGILDKIPEEVGKFEKKLISLELPRIKEFSRLSRNKIAINGSSDFILKLEELCAEKDE